MATPLKKLFPVDPGEEIGACSCHACGGEVWKTVSKSGAVYYNCYNRSEKTGRPCQAHLRWGGADSAAMRRAFLVKSGKLQPAKIATPKADNLDRPPIRAVDDPKPEPKPAPKPAQKVSDYDEYGL